MLRLTFLFLASITFNDPAFANQPQSESFPLPVLHVAPPEVLEARTALPEGIRAMLEASAATEDAAQVAAVAYAATEVYPGHAEAIDIYSTFLRAAINPLTGGFDTVVARYNPDDQKQPPKPRLRTAEQALAPAPSPKFLELGDWTGNVGASGIVAAGNSKTAAAGLLINAQLPRGDLTHNIKLYFDYGRSAGVTTQQKWGAAYKIDYAVSENTFAYGRTSFEDDEFSGFDYKLFLGLGAGHWFVRTEKLAFRADLATRFHRLTIPNSMIGDLRSMARRNFTGSSAKA